MSLTLKLHHTGWGVILTLHIPPHLPLWLWNLSTLDGGVVLTLHIPPYLFDFEISAHWIERGWYWHYTYPPPTSLTLKFQHIRWGVVFTLHIPPYLPLWLWHFSTLDRVGVVLTLHISPSYVFDFETSAHWMGQWYWHYTYE